MFFLCLDERERDTDTETQRGTERHSEIDRQGKRQRDMKRRREGMSYALIRNKSIPDRGKSQRRGPEMAKMFKVFEEQSGRSQWGRNSV